jgi:hypothetical protein
LVIFNNTEFSAATDSHSVLQAMFGRKNVTVSFGEDASKALGDPFLAGNEGLTPEHNTAISAVAILRRTDGLLSLDLFHNPFATVRLEVSSFSGLPVRELVVEDGRLHGYGSWPELWDSGVIERPPPLHGVELPEQKIADFCRRHHIRKLALFGSILRPDFAPDSDIDVLVEFDPAHVPGLAFFGMQEELSEILGRKVDLNTPQWLSPHFRERVQAEAVVQYVAA